MTFQVIRWLVLLVATLVWFALIIDVTSGAPLLQRRGGGIQGDGTWYEVGLGACGETNANSDLVCAISGDQWGNPANPNTNPLCGKHLTVTGPKGSVVVKVVDKCVGCNYGDIDLSPAAFTRIADLGDGRVGITWSYIGMDTEAAVRDSTKNIPDDVSSLVLDDVATGIQSTAKPFYTGHVLTAEEMERLQSEIAQDHAQAREEAAHNAHVSA